jgi:hypothetical protein
MSTSLIPDPANPDPSLTSPPTLPIETPPAGPSEAFLQVLREKDAQVQELQNKLVEVANRASAPPPPPAPKELTDEELNELYYKNPAAYFRIRDQKVKEELDRTVAPLQEMYAGFRRNTVVDGFVEKAKTDPRISKAWTPQLEQYIRDGSGRIPAEQLNEAAFAQIALIGVGMQAIGQLPGQTTIAPANNPPPTNQTPVNDRMITPPHMRPTNTPPAPPVANPNGKTYRPLTENEVRLAREFKMTHEEYLDMLDERRGTVATSMVGRTQP